MMNVGMVNWLREDCSSRGGADDKPGEDMVLMLKIVVA